MSLQSDIAEYKSACHAATALYTIIGTDRDLALTSRHERWAVNRNKRETAENLLMSVITELKPELKRLGLLALYEELSAGKGSDVMLYALADQTVQSFA